MKELIPKQVSLFFAIVLCTMNVFAQTMVRGHVKEGNGQPLPGVSVILKGASGIGVTTDANGDYAIQASKSDVLVFSFVGMHTKEVAVSGNTMIDVTLEENAASLEGIVVVGYGTQKRASLTGAISTVSDKDILKSPTTGISNMIGGRVAGVTAIQHSGQPGADNSSLQIRGQGNIIYVIDGVRRSSEDFNGLDPNEIESVSILKDASAVAIYGLDASSALIVTTKQGRNDKISLSYTGTVGISRNAEKQEWLNGPDYAYWYNKARELQGDEPAFTAEMVQKMKDGVDGWGNTNWYEKVFGTGIRHHHNLSAAGGSDKLRFFSSLGYLDEKGNIDKFGYKRYNLRLNVDAKIAKAWRLNAGIAGRVEKRDAPFFSASPNKFMNIPSQTCYALPFVPETVADENGDLYPVATPTQGSPVSPLGSMNDSGYSRSESTYAQSSLSLRYDAPWLEGLSFKVLGAYDIIYSMYKTLSTPMEVMLLTRPNAETQVLTYKKGYYSVVGNTPALSESASRTNDITTQTSITYNHQSGGHSVETLLLAETRERKSNNLGAKGYGLNFIQLDELSNITSLSGSGENIIPEVSGSSDNSRIAGFVGRLNYNYAERYYLEASLRHDGSYLFGGMNKRWITLPGISVAWRINNEKWFKTKWVDHLKLRASVGKTATSGVGSFQWMNTMSLKENAVYIGSASRTGISASVLGNPHLTWAQCLSYNVGMDASLWNGLLNLEFDTFYKYEFNRLSSVTGAYPPSMGGYYFQTANVNKIDYKGFDLTFSHRNHIGSFNYGAKFIWSYTFGRWLKYAGDSENTPDYQKLTGKQLGMRLGLEADGLFQTQEEIDNSATDPSRPAYPGYIKYVDRNGDGTITLKQDQAYVGKSTVPTHLGSLDLFADWKGFDIDLFFTCGLGHEIAIMGIYRGVEGTTDGVHSATAFARPFYQDGNAPVYLVTNAWTPEHTDAEFPRLEISPRSLNNGYASTFWYRSGNYLRLKTAQIGYSFPQRWLSHVGVNQLRIYVEGFNLLTWSALTKYNIDPEAPSVNNGYYPQQRTVTVGARLTF